MKAIFRCPWCSKATMVDSYDSWKQGEVLFTLCNNCNLNFVVRADKKLRLEILQHLPLPKPTRTTIKKPVGA